jgi:uncharacterized protein (TIGR03435 family)
MRVLAAIVLTTLLSAAFGQSTEPQPKFEVADVHPSPRSTSTVMRSSVHRGSYEIRNATILDLTRTAYNMDADKVFGGPAWLDYDRFDVIGMIPSNTPSQDTLKVMLQALLADRFKLAAHKDTMPVPGQVLSMGKGKPKMKEAEGAGEPGCKVQPQPPRPATPGVPYVPTTLYACRNITMEAFAAALKGIAAAYITNAVVDSTGLKGSWDFDLQFTDRFLLQINLQLNGNNGTTLSDAIDKQLGLKLEEQKIPTPVIVVDRVEKPTANAANLATKMPTPPPAEFEVAEVKPSAPITAANVATLGQAGFFPGGRVNLPRFPLTTGILWGWNLVSTDDIVNPPKWISSTQFDIIAKAPAELSPTSGNAPLQELGPMIKALLIDRFKLTAHFEDRQVNAYTLISVKPKLKKADPSGRTGCRADNSGFVLLSGPNGVPSRETKCQNITMAQFADQLQILASNYVHYPVVDGTGLEGAWDFTISFSPIAAAQLAGLRVANPFGGGPDGPAASDPVGGTSLFDAVEKQLGLKLEMQKRSYPGLVIDHIEEKPTDN